MKGAFFMSSIGSRLKYLRKRKKLTQTQISDITSIPRETLSRYENDSRTPDIPILTELCRLYNCSADFILGLIDTPDPYSSIRDIHESLLFNNQLTFKGKSLSEEQRKLLIESIEFTLKTIEKSSK